ncbi:MAG TPA: uroporphyrinogen decarboxylase family protein [Bryobacteraceae bacterium]|nr:uroporphyrinogen decarboxylase family protein [Bryobacteraceae bacterium]
MNNGGVPFSVVFNPNWWYRNYGISFEESFYLDRETRIRNDVLMRKALWERFGAGRSEVEPRPIIGSRHVAGGFVVPALFGVEVRFAPGQAPWPVPRNLSREQIGALQKPVIEDAWPMNILLRDMDILEREFGYVTGDLNTDGVLNTALLLRGQELFIDMLEAPEVAARLFDIVADVQADVALRVRARTGTCSVSTNRGILNADPSTYLHANCSVQMVSPGVYRRCLLRMEKVLAGQLRPYGIHHCGNNLHLFADLYSETGCAFIDVGWGSDVERSSRAFPEAFLNLRLSPVRMLLESAAEIRRDADLLLAQAARRTHVGICAINLDHGTPDANVLAMMDAARSAKVEQV